MKKVKNQLVVWSEKLITKFAPQNVIDAIITRLANPQIIQNLFVAIVKKQNRVIVEKEIRVKKGKVRYTLLIIHTKHNKLRFNLGRHYNQNGEATINS